MQGVRRLLRELKRKGLHVSGLVIPVLYYIGLKTTIPGSEARVLTRTSAIIILGVITVVHLAVEGMRLRVPSVNRFVLRRFGWLLRRSEYRSVTGAGYYLLGSFLAIALFSPTIAIAAMLFMIFGDFAAALVGTAIGKIRLFARKSLEGSLACFAICFVVGLVLFWRVRPDWSIGVRLALSGAIAATLAEVLPWRLNDNLTIPLLSGLAVLLAAQSLGVIEVPLP
jgi:dolichol kinase